MINQKYAYVSDRKMYLHIAIDIMNSNVEIKTILKTDCHNEAMKKPKGGILPKVLQFFSDRELEYRTFDADKVRLKRARQNFPDLKIDEFDMRLIDKFPYEDGFFDLVMDFSTLDHLDIKRASWVLKEYHRMMKCNGMLALVVWTTDDKSALVHSCDPKEWTPDFQFFFLKKSLLKVLRYLFTVSDEGSLLDRSVYISYEGCDLYRQLTYFLCRKAEDEK